MANDTKIVVLGGTGLLGSHLLFELTKTQSVFASFRNQQKTQSVLEVFKHYDANMAEAQFRKIHWVFADVLDIDTLRDVIQDATQVYHCSALVSFHRIDFYKCIAINRGGTANVVNVCLENPDVKLCYVSSTAAIGQNKEGKTTEKDTWKAGNLNSGYSVSKFGAEKEVWRGIEEGLNAVIINPCVILGAGDWRQGSLSLFKSAQKGLRFYPSGSNATVDARDVSRAMVFLMNGKISAKRFLCTGENTSFQTLFSTLSVSMGKTPPKFRSPRKLALWVGYVFETFNLMRGRRSGLTIENAQSAYKNISYDSGVLKSLLDFEFYTLEESIKNGLAGRLKEW